MSPSLFGECPSRALVQITPLQSTLDPKQKERRGHPIPTQIQLKLKDIKIKEHPN